MSKRTVKPELLAKNIQSYIDENNSKRNVQYVINSDGCFFFSGGKMIPDDAPITPTQLDSSSVAKGENLDGRTNWIQ